MHEHVKRLLDRAKQLGQRAYETGWISASALRGLHQVEHRTPTDLFASGGERPLVVALFGGTGVGKSSLLNRLAGASIAKVGVERPTSREVTVYVHENVELNELPSELPLRDVRIARHTNAAQRDVMWVDCPDIDSTVTANRALALAWLAHVDLVIYVVSPERYRDDSGWRVLQQRGGRHGWAFVMNRGDEGRPEQKADFEQELRRAGFDTPRVFVTTCRGGDETRHEFDVLVAFMNQLISAHAVRELERRGLRSRLFELRDALRRAFEPLGSEADWQSLAAQWDRRWNAARESLAGEAHLPLRGIAQRLARSAAPPPGLLAQAISARLTPSQRSAAGNTARPNDADDHTEAPLIGVAAVRTGVWDGFTGTKIMEALDGLEVDAAQCGLASVPLRRRIDEVVAAAPEVVSEIVWRAAAESLGDSNRDARAILRGVCGSLCYLLPVCGLAWAGYLVVNRFYMATTATQPTAFLGMDFAVHTLLLLLIAWAAPFAMYVALRSDPSVRIAQSLRRAFTVAIDRIGYAARAAISETGASAASVRGELQQLLDEIERCAGGGAIESPLVASLVPTNAG